MKSNSERVFTQHWGNLRSHPDTAGLGFLDTGIQAFRDAAARLVLDLYGEDTGQDDATAIRWYRTDGTLQFVLLPEGHEFFAHPTGYGFVVQAPHAMIATWYRPDGTTQEIEP